MANKPKNTSVIVNSGDGKHLSDFHLRTFRICPVNQSQQNKMVNSDFMRLFLQSMK